ncbi:MULTISPECIES: hypothetical protein [unclassified Yoonia]|uniref:hypothetical protein n=1 Tax=unclassified Yoonia TaxID=2629118 RepID=UPI002AFFFEDF|nr:MULTISPECIES: hypothetical protein [unclassified Yoonia]
MTKTNGLVLAALLMASTSPMAIGQTTNTDPATTPPAGTEPAPLPGSSPTDITPAPMPGDAPTGTDTMPGTGTTPATDMGNSDMDYLIIIAELNMPSPADMDWSEEFADLSEDAEVEIVTLSQLAGADDPAAPMMDQAMANLDNDQDTLRSAIADSDVLSSALENADYTAEQVVAALMDRDGEGGVTLIVDDEAASGDAAADEDDGSESDG